MTKRLAFLLALLPATLLVTACASTSDDDDAGECRDINAAANPPTITTSAPNDATIFTSTDVINVVAQVSDAGTDPTILEITLSELINVTPEELDVPAPSPDADGRVAFSIPAGTFDPGDHVLRIEVTDPDGCSANDEILLCVDSQTCPSS